MAALHLPTLHAISIGSHCSARKKLWDRPALRLRKIDCPVVTRNKTRCVTSAVSAADERLPTAESMQNDLKCSSDNNMLGTVVIAGGGPAGCLMAHYLLLRGFHVQLFEKREAPKLRESHEQLYSKDDIRSYPMSITTRALNPLKGAHVELPSNLALRTVGGTQHFGNGKKVKFDSIFSNDLESFIVGRNDLVGYLQQLLNQRYSGRLSMKFGWEVERISDSDNVVTLKRAGNDKTSEEPAQLEVHFDLLIGADGANSVVRKEILRMGQLHTNSGESTITEEIIENPNWYKSIHISPKIAARSPLYEDFNRIQRWVRLDLLLLGLADGSFWIGSNCPELVNATNPGIVKSILRKEAPEVLELVLDEDPNWCEKFVAQSSRNMGKAVILSHFHKGNIVVIGDAAHPMFPTYGTGCNTALEDCAVLDKILQNLLNSETEKDALNQIGAEFTKYRMRDAHTIVRLSVSKSLFPRTKLDFLQRLFLSSLQKWFPAVIPRPASTFLLSTKSFSSIRKQKLIEDVVFYSLLTLLALALLLISYKLARISSSELMRKLVK